MERGLKKDAGSDATDLVTTANKEALQDLQAVLPECLQKAGLTELNEKIRNLKLQ